MKALTMIATALVLSLASSTADAQKRPGDNDKQTRGERAVNFAIGDVDQNGVVDLQDAKRIFMLATAGGSKGYAPLEAFDTNQDGRVDVSDSVEVINRLAASEAQQLRAVPQEKMVVRGDADGDGKLTVADIATVGLYLAGKRPELTLDVAFQAADIDGDGKVGKNDLRKIMKRLSPKS